MSMSSFDAADLVRQCEQAAWVRTLARRLVQRDDVDDVAQEAWAHALRGPAPHAGRHRAWFWSVIQNVATSRHRGEARRRRREAAAATPNESEAKSLGPGELAARLEQHSALIAAVQELDEPYKCAILQRYFEDMSPRDIAARTGTPVRTVHTRLNRALTMLRARLDQRHSGDRRAWIAALAPFTGPTAGAASTTFAIMSPNAKLAVTALACVATLTFGTLWFSSDRQGGERVNSLPPPALTAPSAIVNSTAAADAGAQRAEIPTPARATPPAPATEPFVLAGVVYDLEARPIPGVNVALRAFGGTEPLTACRSDPDGKFRFVLKDVQSGHLDVDEAGWTTIYRTVLWGNRDVGELTLVVAPSVEVRGVVVDDANQPIAGANVQLTAGVPPRSAFPGSLERNLVGEWGTETDEDGSFVLARAPKVAGTALQTTAAGFADDRRALPDDPMHVRIQLLPTRALLNGQVLRADGTPAADVPVFWNGHGVHSDAAGRFTIDLARVQVDHGRQLHCWLIAATPGWLPARVRCLSDADWRNPRAWPQPLVLRFADAALRIEGAIVEANGQPLPDATVTALDAEPLGDPAPDLPINSMSTIEFMARVHARVTPNSGEFWDGDGPVSAGRFSIGGLQQKTYRLRVEHRASLRTFVTRPIAAGSSNVELRMPPGEVWGEVAGIVRDRRGHPVAKARLWCTRGSAQGDVSTERLETDAFETDADGRFHFAAGLTREVDRLLVQAQSIAWPTEFPLHRSGRLDALELTVPIRAAVKVLRSPSSVMANGIAFCRRDGTRVGATITQGNMAWGQAVVPLTDGSSETITVPDDAIEAVLLDGETVLGRYPVDLSADELHELRF